MKVSELKPNPINSTIYNNNPEALEELKNSIYENGLLEPITITKSKMVISGHRRLEALTQLGFETCECRITFFENTTIATIELNRYRFKTESEIVREAEVLKEEYTKFIKKGRPLKGEEKVGKSETITDVSKTLNVSTTKLKKLLSIKNYEPELLKKIDLGLVSVEGAYQIVRKKYIIPKTMGDEKSYDNKNFRTQINRLMDKYNPPFEVMYQMMLKQYQDQDMDGFDVLKSQQGVSAHGNEREENDFYPTPPLVTKLFLEHEELEGKIWEPACGQGHISKELEKMYDDVISTDLYDRGYGESGVDFLEDINKKEVDTIITNPPFTLFSEFVEQSKKIGANKICLFGKTSYLEGRDRYNRIWTDKKYPLKKVVQYVDRLTLKKNEVDNRKRGMVSYCWYVFEKKYKGKPTIEWI